MTLRHAARSLAKSPGFVTVAILALGLGLGLTTTMFGLMEAVVHPAVPFREPDRLYSVTWFYNMRRPPLTSFEMFTAIRDQTRSFAAAVPYYFDALTMETGTEPGDINVATVPARMFGWLGLEHVRGRTLNAADALDGGVVISHGLWRRALGGRSSVVGSTIVLGGVTRTVVGVMPRGMVFPMYADAWLAMPEEVERAGAARGRFRTFVKLKPGVTRAAAEQEVTLLAQRLTAMHAEQDAPFSIRLATIAGTADRVRETQKFMLVAAIAILLIACANLANLMLARGMAKRRELALRMAVGASRWAIVKQLFAEAALITVAGALVGIVAALWGGDIVTNRVPRSMEWLGLVEPRLSIRVFALTLVSAAAGAVLFGLIPAAKLTLGVDVAEPLKNGGTTTERSHKRHSWLVVIQIAIALPLVIVAGVMLMGLYESASYEVNYAAPELVAGSIGIPDGRAEAAVGVQGFADEVVASIRAMPDVRDAAFSTSATPRGLAISAEMTSDTPRVLNLPSYPVVSPNFLATMGLRVIEGRDFEPGDVTAAGAVILDADAAAWLYPGQSPVGRMVRLGAPLSGAPWVRVVGVANSPSIAPRHAGRTISSGSLWVVRQAAATRRVKLYVRSPHADARLAAAIVRRLRTSYPGVAVGLKVYLEDYQISVRAMLFFAELFIALGACALGLGAVGLYGVIAYTVSRRMREFAVRIALGADRVDVRRLVFHDAAAMVLMGTALGAVPAVGISGAGGPIPALLLLGGSEAVLIAVMLAACAAPARRAAGADPMHILRAT